MLLLLWLPQVEDGGVLCAEENINRQVNVAHGVSLASHANQERVFHDYQSSPDDQRSSSYSSSCL